MADMVMGDFRNGTMPYLALSLLDTEPFNIGEWQSTDISTIPEYATHELTDITAIIDVPPHPHQWMQRLGDDVNYDWAEEHFQERVSGTPFNPPPSHKRWPWARHNGNHQNDQTQFSHTYPERMWPKWANPSEIAQLSTVTIPHPNLGIRFAYGDLSDVVDLLTRSRHTRQAYLPIWFPEDTGAVHRQRVPCTLGYHFMIRDNQLSCRYYMRSCDLVRHFPDDVYLAGRLMQWVCNWLDNVIPGQLIMYIASLHAFAGDRYALNQIVKRVATP